MPENWLDWLLPTGCLSVLLGYLLAHYSKPDIGYHSFQREDNGKSLCFLVRSFEPVDLEGELRLVVSSDCGITSLEVFGGPWVKDNPKDLTRTQIEVVFEGFPAEGVVSIHLTVETPASSLKLLVAENSAIKPRRFGELRKWTFGERARTFVFRWLTGLALSCVSYYFGRRFLFPEPVNQSELLLTVLTLAAGCAFLFFFVVPFSGKETVLGYLGWREGAYRLDKMPPSPHKE